MSEPSSGYRIATQDELPLLKFLLVRTGRDPNCIDRSGFLVQPMSDGNMGSLVLRDDGLENVPGRGLERKFGQRISECRFRDVDQVPVSAPLNIDQHGRMFELDVWKTDFTEAVRIPEEFE